MRCAHALIRFARSRSGRYIVTNYSIGIVSYQTRVVALGVCAVLVFDLVASLAARRFGFPYTRAGIGSYILYLIIGYLAARGALRDPLRTAATASAIAGFADASLGWAISWRLGVGKLPDDVVLTPRRWVSTAVVVVMLAVAVGTLGGLVGRRPPSIDGPAV